MKTKLTVADLTATVPSWQIAILVGLVLISCRAYYLSNTRVIIFVFTEDETSFLTLTSSMFLPLGFLRVYLARGGLPSPGCHTLKSG